MTGPGQPFQCEHQPDVAPYVLGALDDAEAQRFAQHLHDCAVCSGEVAELRPVVDLLPVSVPPATAPPELRDRIMSVVHAEAELLRAAGDTADRPPARRPHWSFRPLAALGAAAALGVGVLVGALVISGPSSSPAVHQTAAVVSAPSGQAVLRRIGDHTELDVTDLPSPPAGHIYEVWLAHGQRLTPTDALFGVNHSGDATVAVPGSLQGVGRVMVTAEPPGGSSVPTTAPIVVVRLARS